MTMTMAITPALENLTATPTPTPMTMAMLMPTPHPTPAHAYAHTHTPATAVPMHTSAGITSTANTSAIGTSMRAVATTEPGSGSGPNYLQHPPYHHYQQQQQQQHQDLHHQFRQPGHYHPSHFGTTPHAPPTDEGYDGQFLLDDPLAGYGYTGHLYSSGGFSSGGGGEEVVVVEVVVQQKVAVAVACEGEASRKQPP